MQSDEESITVGDGAAWSTLDKSTSDISRSRVENCKGDVDTLLVFAGLYSAVLTAFLIESYKNLQEDPQETMIALLRQISLQTNNYTLVTGRLISAVMPESTPPPFSAALTDIRVNVCWFSSLVLSLSSASFGMLLQQWLREYLYIDRTVPQERLRIRYFRSRGLEVWKLYEIASVLPLILQVSLLLFFVGLCFFTASVHSSIGTATLLLVCAWAAFFGFALLAPLISPRCPYKTTFLKSAFRQCRLHILGSHVDSLPDLQAEHGHTDGIAVDIFSKYQYPSDIIMCEEDKLCRTDQNDLAIFHAVDAQTLDDATLITVKNILSSRPPPGENVLQLVVSTVRNRLAIRSFETYKMGVDHNPNPILSFLTSSARITFVDILVGALRAELQMTSVDQWYLEPVGREWMDDALVLIVALVPPNMPIPLSATSLFLRIVQPDTGSGINYRGCALISDRIVTQVAGRRTSWQWQSTVFACLVDAMKSCDLAIFRDIVHWSYIDDADVDLQSNTYKRLLDDAGDDSCAVQRNTLAILFQVAIAIQYHYVIVSDATDTNLVAETHPSDSRQLTDFILDSYLLIEDLIPRSRSSKPRIHGSVGIDEFFAAYFSVPSQLPIFLDHMWARPELTSTQRVRDLLQNPLNEAWKLQRPSLEIQTSVLSVCAQFFSSCRQRNLDNPSNIQSILGLYLVVATYPTQRDEQTILLWRRICDDTLQCIAHIECLNPVVIRAANSSSVAYAILGLIDQDSEDQNWVYRVGRADVRGTTQFTDRHRSDENNRYAQWRKEFDSNTSFYTDAFVKKMSEIAEIHEDPLGRRFWRVRLLEDREKEHLRTNERPVN